MRATYDPATVTGLVEATLAAAPRLGASRLLCIDGPAGSGKTTLAAAVVQTCRERRILTGALHMDDFYRDWTGLDHDLERRMTEQVLRPLAAGRGARWQQYDWYTRRFTTWHDLPAPDVLVVEGCGSGAWAYRALVSVLVWVEAPADERISRGVERDGVQVLPQWQRWMEREQAYFEVNRTRERADVVVSTAAHPAH